MNATLDSSIGAAHASAGSSAVPLRRYLLFNVVVTFVIALSVTWLVPSGGSFTTNLIFSYCIGLTIFALHSCARVLLLPRFKVGFAWQLAGYVLAIPLGFAIGCRLASWMTGLRLTDHDVALMFSLIGGSFGVMYAINVERQRRAEAAHRNAACAQLRALQAQVEPHFLFNTLASLDALIAIDGAAARTLLAHLNRYLRLCLVHARSESACLDTEFALLRAYLGIMAMRLQDRLRLRIECAPDCAALPFPPMLVQPLVENAVTHGVEPCREGGEISVLAWREADQLLVCVSDTGAGWGRSPNRGTGTGLSNVRDRLQALYGGAAALRTLTQQPQGTRVELSIPIRLLEREAV